MKNNLMFAFVNHGVNYLKFEANMKSVSVIAATKTTLATISGWRRYTVLLTATAPVTWAEVYS